MTTPEVHEIPHTGQRVAVAPYTDCYMRGDRCGEVVGKALGHNYVLLAVKFDRSGEIRKLHPSAMKVIA